MTGIAIKTFRGRVPRVNTRLLNDNQAVVARNLRLDDGKLVPINRPLLTHTSALSAAIATAYRYKFNGVENWLVWPEDVDVARNPTAQDALGRFYFSGAAGGEPRMSTYALAISGGGPYPTAWYVMGVAKPVTAPSLTVVGGAGPTEDRAYIYTFVTALGEESGISPPVRVTGNTTGGASWNLSALDAAPPNTGTITAVANNTPSAGFVRATYSSVFGLREGELQNISGVAGMTDLNGTRKIVSIDVANKYVVYQLVTAQAYTSGGVWARTSPHNTTGMTKRIYRSLGTTGAYFFVAEIAVGTTTYSDTIASSVVALNSTITAFYTEMPPTNLRCLRALASGVMVGLSGDNQLCFSEAFKPQSWPIGYRQAFPAVGVALGEGTNSVIVLTDSQPYLFTLTSPANVSRAPIGEIAPCLVKRGCADTKDGIVFPSHDGLHYITPSGATKLTESLYSQSEWKALNPKTFNAAVQDNRYYAVHDNGGTSPRSIWMIDLDQPDGTVEHDEAPDTLYSNVREDGELYISIGSKLYLWDGDASNRKTAYWQSKDFEMPYPLAFSVAQVKAEYSDIVPVSMDAYNANLALITAGSDFVEGDSNNMDVNEWDINGSALVDVPDQTSGFVQFSLLPSKQVAFTRGCTAELAFRLPPKIHQPLYAVAMVFNITVTSVFVAQSMRELGGA